MVPNPIADRDTRRSLLRAPCSPRRMRDKPAQRWLIGRTEFGCILPAMNRSLDRREFVKLAGAAGVVAATAGSPVLPRSRRRRLARMRGKRIW